MRRRLIAAFLLVALLGAGSAGAAEKAPTARLAEADVAGVVTAMEDAARNGDPRTVASYMSDDCVITTSFPSKDGGKKVTRKNRDQFVEDELASAAKHSGRVYETAKPEIVVDPSGRSAKASYKVRETYTEEGRKVQLVAYEIATVELRDGDPMVTAVDVDAVAMSIDDRRIF